MEACLIQLRSELEIINPFEELSSGGKPRFTKTGRLKAVTALNDALSRRQVISALTTVSKQEMIRGPDEEPDKLLGWGELSCTMLLTLNQVCTETANARNASRPGSTNMRPVYMKCFRSVLRLALKHGPPGVLRHLVRPVLSYCHEWLSEPSLRNHLSDQIWQCVRDILLDEVNRALLLPAYVKTWTDACFEQLTGRGALKHSSHVVTNIAGDILQIIATSVASYDTLSQTTRRASPSTMLGGDFSYAFIAERCCMMLIVAESMPRRKAREVQSIAFRTLTIILTDHAVDFTGSSAVNSITNASLKPLLSCWSEKKYHIPAVSFCKILLLLAACDKRLVDAVRHRILVDLREESSSAIIRTGKEISTDYVDSAAACFTFSECLEFAGSTEKSHGVVIFWLRVAFAIISGRVLKLGTSVIAEAADVLDQCSKAADVVTAVLKKHGNIRDNDYINIIQCCTMITKVAATLAEKVHASGTKSSIFGKASWQELYKVLREHATKARYSVRSHETNLKTHEASVQAEDLILQNLALLCRLQIIDNSTIEHMGTEGNQVGSEPYPVSRLLSKGPVKPTRFEIEYFRSIICRAGLAHDSGGRLRFQLVSTLLSICYEEDAKSSSQARVLEEVAASVLALVRGECTLSDQEYVGHRTRHIEDSFNLVALHSFQSFFGLNMTRQKILSDGESLVRGVSDQDPLWKGFCYWNTQSSFLAGTAAQAIVGDAKSVLIDPIIPTQPRHFSVNSHLVYSLEKEIFEHSQEVFSSAVLSRQKENLPIGQNDSERCRPGDVAQCEEVTFLDCEALGKGLRLIIFLSCYICQGIRLGLFSIASHSSEDEHGRTTELAHLLLDAIRSFAASSPEDLMANYTLTKEAVKWSSRLCTLLAKVHENHSCDDPQDPQLNIHRALSSSIISITTALSRYLFRRLEEYDLKTVEFVQGFGQDGLPVFSCSHGTLNRRKRRRTSETPGRLSKRRRARSPAFSVESIESGASEGCSRTNAVATEIVNRDFKGHSEDSDGLRSISDEEPDDNDWRIEEESAPTQAESKAAYWRKSFEIIETAVRELEQSKEVILETLIQGLKALDDVERALSPDGFERAALLSSLVDPSVLEARRWIWSVLLTIGTGNALKAVAEDLLRIGTNWQRLEQTDHEYISYYAVLIETGKRKQYPVLPKTEESRVLFLHYARALFEKALEIDRANNGTYAQHAETELRRLAVEIIGTSEYFRQRHAFRMPRITRIAYLRFAHSFLHFVEYFQTKASIMNPGTPEETTLTERAHLLRNVMCKFLVDSECIVRMVASTILPEALSLGFCAEGDSLERTLDDSLPQITSCDDSKEFFGRSGRLQDNAMTDTTYATWNPSDDECNAFALIHESFRLLGASAKGYSTFMCISELAIRSEDLIPFCIIQVLIRVASNSRFLCSGYHVMVRLCSALKYRSPSHLYAAFSRLLLPKWFEMQDSTEAIYCFPASLLVNSDHHKEGILYDWLRDHQTELLSHILVQEKATSLDLTVKFAGALQEDPASLLKRNVSAFALLYPMQFTDGLHDRGKLLWHAVDSLLDGSSMTLMFEKKSDVIDAFLRSVSTNWNPSLDNDNIKPHSAGKMGFSRDTRTLKPPFYDALVIALAINHLFASDSDIFIVQRSVLQGSLFIEVRDEQTGHILADRFVEFLKECQRTNVTLLKILATILRLFEGPPSPQPKRNSLDAFFCVGMVWRMLDDAILMKPKNERVTFFRLIANGFRHDETARDAIWLLGDVQTKVTQLHLKHPKFAVSESELDIEEQWGRNLAPISTSRERQMYELLSTVSPFLTSIVVKTSSYCSDLRCLASKALMDLLNVCSEESFWNAVLSNGPFPHHRLFKDARKIYERARSFGQVSLMDDKVGYLLINMSRFRCVYQRLGKSESSVNILACLQEISHTLDEDTANKVSKSIKSEAWLRSNGMVQNTLPQIAETLSCLLDLILKFSPSRHRGEVLPTSKASKDSFCSNTGRKELFEDLLFQEAARLISILGLLQSHSSSFFQAETYYKSIPPKQSSGQYEEVESGIRLSLLLLQDLLHSNLPVQVQVGLETLLAVLKTNDGRRIYGKQKGFLGNLSSFKSTERGGSNSVKVSLPFTDPFTGTVFSLSSFPDLRSPKLWCLPKGGAFDEHSLWVRKLCTILAHSCRSKALKSLASACFSSYKVSCNMLPYLFMDIICDLDEKSCSDVSKLLRHHILLNTKAPVALVRAFVHALDVLCQIGLEVVSSKGVLSWVRNTQQGNVYSYYYVLEVPYLEAAQAALRSGASFSALRFAQLYIDQRGTRAEIKQSAKAASYRPERRYSSCPLRDPALERAEIDAREKAIPLVREAMLRISEPDGIRAFGENGTLARSAANIAALDGDWSRSLSALDVATRSSDPMPSESAMQSDGRDKSTATIDFQKELDVLHSFFGLGTIQIATDYWEGLRNRVCRQAIPKKSHHNLNADQYIDQLNELRFAAAWKLEQWDSPPILPQKGARVIGGNVEPLGFHKAVYLTLRLFMIRRYAEIPRILSRARQTILQRFCDGTSIFSGKSLFENSSRLHICHVLERLALQETKPSSQAKAHSSVPEASFGKASSQACRTIGDSNPDILETAGYIVNQGLDSEDVISQILGDDYGVGDEIFRNGLVISRDAFHSGILAEDIPVVLIRCLQKTSLVARMSATTSARILSKDDAGAWPRAASCLGTMKSSLLDTAPQKDIIAWKLQESRLRWSASHDAPSKKQALAAVKDIISSNLGGKALDRASSDVSDSSSFQQSLSWQHGEIDGESLALLRSQACILAAGWSLEMKTHEPMDLFQMYLESGLVAAAQNSRVVGRAHFAMASFADAQINNIDSYRKSRKYDSMVTAVTEMEEKISNLEKMKAERKSKTQPQSRSSRKPSRSSRSSGHSDAATNKQINRDLDVLIRSERKKARQDRARLEKLNETYQKWQLLACQHFALSLCAGGIEDLRAAFRMVALWLDAGQMRTKITTALVEKPNLSSNKLQKIMVPVSKLLPLAPQLASRLNKSESKGDPEFQDTLSGTITEMAGKFPAHCLWQLLALSNATRGSGNQEKLSSLYRGDEDKKGAAEDILRRLQEHHGETVSEMKKVAHAYILLSETDEKRKANGSLELRGCAISQLGELRHVPVPTVPIPLSATDFTQKIPHITAFEKRASVCAGLSKPLKVVCVGSDGERYPQIVKGRDDLRGDAVMEQMFTILNSLLEKEDEAARRSLHIRTYRIIPLSPFSGIMQFVSNTMPFRQVLVEGRAGASGKAGSLSLHERYHPYDLKHNDIARKAFKYREQSGGSDKVMHFLKSVWHRFQPAFRFFFTEQWPDPGQWFGHQLNYSRSVAVMSMVGFILGLGDRHLANILLDVSTAEVVHIDFGIAFEQGKLLPTPEHMPFRLTRDLVDGFGVAGVEGVFRRCSEITLSIMRTNKDVMLTVIEVLLHDPMYSWALTPEEVLREQKQPQGSDGEYFESNELSRSFDESCIDAVARDIDKKVNGSKEAQRALMRISEKLDGLEGTERLSVEAHVARLIDEAQAFHVLASVYPGWMPWL